MTGVQLAKDPYNIIVTGVGGQGNVLAARLLGEMLARKGFLVTIGETFGASQRGGSVMSHVRISRRTAASPQIPRGQADVICSLEPVEAVRVLADYGNPATVLLTNTHPIFPVGVIKGDLTYPPVSEMAAAVKEILPRAYLFDATARAVALGNPILVNIIMLGALGRLGVLPCRREDFHDAITRRLPAAQRQLNLQAFAAGYDSLNDDLQERRK
ncbi:MAG TPA: indolepyruvate oxidoreductase subunit beta [Syntrophales bacterium]|jgi:indolepyruvate ferredoxin oxidoreductase beta subunit|nr:indolepyruvate oxidoreductase subunit beta [Syntrophales bacterium]HOU77175.1 indolepyruvate oxidoreductase subunit beta [Syntrophales bacterium]HPC32060.1 indolepyruvate oxidoreductase subunit beta [Syntrophales bacterium]HQG33807.1 indolepyruvate oxidoreductase subunit beta [Syntrophales bacterium]HQI35185.1 indolepyruvate oxidoreductase subunit beta [Syntrophales bacterium]